jgi:hypothetical protein
MHSSALFPSVNGVSLLSFQRLIHSKDRLSCTFRPAIARWIGHRGLPDVEVAFVSFHFLTASTCPKAFEAERSVFENTAGAVIPIALIGIWPV